MHFLFGELVTPIPHLHQILHIRCCIRKTLGFVGSPSVPGALGWPMAQMWEDARAPSLEVNIVTL